MRHEDQVPFISTGIGIRLFVITTCSQDFSKEKTASNDLRSILVEDESNNGQRIDGPNDLVVDFNADSRFPTDHMHCKNKVFFQDYSQQEN